MCLLIINEENVAQIATEDIICYKVLQVVNDKLYSPFFTSYEYKLNELATSELKCIKLKPISEITQGLHSIIDEESANRIKRILIHDCELMRISILSSEIAQKYLKKYTVVKCLIPAGSTYYTGIWNVDNRERLVSYASDRLIVVEII